MDDIQSPRNILNEADTEIVKGEQMSEPLGVPRAFTCDYCPELREAVARVEARQTGDSEGIKRIEITLQAQMKDLIHDLAQETRNRTQNNLSQIVDITRLKSETKQTAATVSAVVAFLVAIGGQLAIKFLLG